MTGYTLCKYSKEGYEIIIKTNNHEHYKTTVNFAKRLIGHPKSQTNADRIRSMSDEELAKYLFESGYDEGWPSAKDALEWLQQPAEVNE